MRVLGGQGKPIKRGGWFDKCQKLCYFVLAGDHASASSEASYLYRGPSIDGDVADAGGAAAENLEPYGPFGDDNGQVADSVP